MSSQGRIDPEARINPESRIVPEARINPESDPDSTVAPDSPVASVTSVAPDLPVTSVAPDSPVSPVTSVPPVYKRVVIKISGEALSGPMGHGLDNDTLEALASELKTLCARGIQVALVTGGGNIWRGVTGSKRGMDRATADYMGMLATCINALALQDTFERFGMDARVMSAIDMRPVAETYIRRKAIRHLEKDRVVILAAGTGSPFFSTDTTAALRAAELGADIILMAKNVDAVYDSDPKINPKAKKFDRISYMDALSMGLKVMDATALSLCMENNIPIAVFGLSEKGSVLKAAMGDKIGTYIGGV